MLIRTLALAAVAAFAAGSSAAAQSYTLKVASPTNNDVILKWMETFKSGVEAGSDGQIVVELYPANQLGQIPATIEGVAFGTIEVTAPASGFFVTMDQRFEVFDVPGLFTSLKHAQRVLADPEVMAHITQYGNNQGLVPIAAFPHGPLGLLTVNGVRTLEDFKGQKIRAAGPTPLHIAPLTELGALPNSMALGEVMPAMQNRAVDGLLAGMPVFTTARYYDVAKPVNLLPSSYLIVTAVASQAFLDQIGDELEALVREQAAVAVGVANEWNIGAVENVLQAWQDNGGEIVRFDEADSAKYLETVAALMPTIDQANPALADEVDFIRAAAERLAD